MRIETERVERDDLVLFINACFACNGQAEYYGSARGQAVSIEFLHEYIHGNYRRLYARTLAAGINHFNQGLIVANLLASGAPAAPAQRAEEGALVLAALRAMPPARAYRALLALRERHVNNRRARAVVRAFLAARPSLAFDAVKYRAALRALAEHAHAPLPGELGAFLFAPRKKGDGAPARFADPLLDAVRRAATDPEAVYELPFTIAEGFAARHKIPREQFLARIAPRMTALEQLRYADAAARASVVRGEGAGGDDGALAARDDDAAGPRLDRVPLTRLALYVLSRGLDERAARRGELDAALAAAAQRALRRAPAPLGRVAAVLDCSESAAGSHDKARRPLAVALGASYLLRAAAREYRAFWTAETPDEVAVRPRGLTDLASPLAAALAWGAELVIIVSDGFENDPPGAAGELARVFRAKIDPHRRTALVHMNPVFDAERYAPRTLGSAVPTVGLRDAEDLLTMLGFARFADGAAPLSELEAYLAARVERMLAPAGATER